MSNYSPPAPPKDRQLKEGEIPTRRYRLIQEEVESGIFLFRIEKRILWFWKMVWPTDNYGILFGGNPDKDKAEFQFEVMAKGRKIKVIDQA